MSQVVKDQEKIKKIIKDALMEKGYVVIINGISYSSCIGFDIDLHISEKYDYIREFGVIDEEEIK